MDIDSNSFDEASSTFLNWFTSQPGTTFHPSLAIRDLRSRGAGRGIIATSDIPPETDLFTIPRNRIISIETSELARKLPEIFKDALETVDEDIADQDGDQEDKENGTHDLSNSELPLSWLHLILIMLHETLRSPPSAWQAYLSILPSQPSDFTTPIFWSDDDLARLQASSLSSKIGRSTADSVFRTRILPIVKSHASTFYGTSDTSTYLSDEDLITKCHVIASLIMSYAFDLQPDDDDDDSSTNENNEDGWTEDKESSSRGTMGMIPVADLLNADAEFNAHLSHGTDNLTMTSLRTIRAGEEVLNYYGPLPNSELLRRYGYTSAKHARYDVVDVSWELVKRCVVDVVCSTDETQKDAVTQVLRKVEDEDEHDVSDGFTLERDSGDPNEEGLCTHPAKFVSFPEDLVGVLQDVVSEVTVLSSIRQREPKELEQEVKRQILVILRTIVEKRTEEYATRLEEDEELLKGEISERMRMAVEVRLGEKRVLREAMEWCDGMLVKYADAQNASGSIDGRAKRNGGATTSNGEPPSKKQRRGR